MAGWRARATRAALGLAVLAPTVAGVVLAPSPAGAATRQAGEIVVDDAGGQVFATEGDTVGVYDLDGARVATIEDQLGAADLVLRGRTLYVLARGAERVNRIDADSHEMTGGWSLATTPGARTMAWTAGRLWFTYGDQLGDLGSLDPATGAVRASLGRSPAETAVAATESPDRLYVLPTASSPAPVTVYDVTTTPKPTVVSTLSGHGGNCSSGHEVVVDAAATTAWTACGAPYSHSRWDLSEPDPTAPEARLVSTPYPNGIALSSDESVIVGSIQAATANVRLYERDGIDPLKLFSVPVRPSAGMVAVSTGGGRIFVGTQDGAFHTIRLDPVVTSVAPTPVDRGAVVTVTGTGLTDVTEVRLGDTVAAATIVSDTTLRLTVPAGLVNGSYPLFLTSRWGDSADTPATVRVHGPEAPHAPGQPSVVAAGPHAATVTWPTLDDDSWPATSFEVTAWVGGQAVATETVAASPAVLTGLRAETAHTFTVVAVNEVGRSAASPASAPHTPAGPAVAPFPSITAFVARQHLDLLGRAPLVGESETWVDDLQLGVRLPADLVVALRGSADHTANVDPVVRMYQAYFLRTPDADGLRYWIGERRAGRSINQVSQAFAASGEFRTLYGALSNRQFVGRIYRNVLGRTGSAAEIDYWTVELDSGRRNRGGVMTGFSESAEYKAAQRSEVTTSVLHVLLLGRRPTASELTTTVERLDGGTPVATIAAEILGSGEYAEHIAG